MIRAALSASGVSPDDIDAVEAHGTGTSLGDPIEAGASGGGVWADARGEERPLWLGSSKSNIGHAQAAAGVLGVIKMVLSLQHERLPKTLARGASERADRVGRAAGCRCCRRRARGARTASRVRRAGVSSFGISGTNAHVVLEEGPARRAAAARGTARRRGAAEKRQRGCRYRCWCRVETRRRCVRRLERYADWLSTASRMSIGPLCVSTAALHRTHFAARASVSARDAAEATEALRALGEGGRMQRCRWEQRASVVAWCSCFPGKAVSGRRWVERCWRSRRCLPRPLRRVTRRCVGTRTGRSRRCFAGTRVRGVPPLERVDVIQPALFAMNVALAAVWRSLGLEPACCGGAQPRRDSGGRGRWHFITGRGRSGGGAAQPVAEADERQRQGWR